MDKSVHQISADLKAFKELLSSRVSRRRSNARLQEGEDTDNDSDAASSSSSTHSTIHMPAGTPPRMNSLESNGADADTENDVLGNNAQVEYRKHDSDEDWTEESLRQSMLKCSCIELKHSRRRSANSVFSATTPVDTSGALISQEDDWQEAKQNQERWLQGAVESVAQERALRLIEKSASEWQKTVGSLEDEVTRLRRRLSEKQMEIDILDLRKYKVDQAHESLLRHMRYLAAGSKWRELASASLADCIGRRQRADMERMAARGTCYIHLKMWRSDARRSAQRSSIAQRALTFSQEVATRRLCCHILRDWLRVASAGSLLFVGHYVGKTISYVEGVRSHGLVSRHMAHWKSRWVSSALIKAERKKMTSLTYKGWARVMHMQQRSKRAHARVQTGSVRNSLSEWQRTAMRCRLRQQVLWHVGEAHYRSALRRLGKRSMLKWRRCSKPFAAHMARRRTRAWCLLCFKMWVGYASMSANSTATSVALISHIKAKAAASARVRALLTRYMAKWSSAGMRTRATQPSQFRAGTWRQDLPRDLRASDLADLHSPYASERSKREQIALQHDIEREIAHEMQLVRAMWSIEGAI